MQSPRCQQSLVDRGYKDKKDKISLFQTKVHSVHISYTIKIRLQYTQTNKSKTNYYNNFKKNHILYQSISKYY